MSHTQNIIGIQGWVQDDDCLGTNRVGEQRDRRRLEVRTQSSEDQVQRGEEHI